MDVASVYLEAQETATATAHAPSINPLQDFLPNASNDPILAKLQGLPRHRTDASSNFKASEPTIARLTDSGVLERLSWSAQRVVWTLGDSIERIFDFDESEQSVSQIVRQALWADFLFEGTKAAGNQVNNASSQRVSVKQEKARKLFGPFAKPLAELWSDSTHQSSSTSSTSNHSRRPGQHHQDRVMSGICIFLTEALHIVFPQTGRHVVVHMPFLLKRAWPLPGTGLLLERQLEIDEQSQQPLGLDAPLPTLYTLRDLYDEFQFVSHEQQVHLSATPAIPRSQPFTDAKSDILLLSKKYNCVLSFNRATAQLHLSRLTRIEESPQPIPNLSDSPLRSSQHPRPYQDPAASPSQSVSEAGPSAAPSAADRTFVGEGQADHALGADAPAGGFAQQQGVVQSDARLQGVWESGPNLDLKANDQLKAVLFDERESQAYVAVHVPRNNIFYLFRLLLQQGSKIQVEEVRTEVASAIYPCTCTRPSLSDLLLVNSDGQTRVLTAAASIVDVGLTVSNLSSLRVTGHVLQASPQTPHVVDLRCWSHRDALTEQCWRALSQSLSIEEFLPMLQKSILKRSESSDWLTFEDLVLGRVETEKDDLWTVLLQSRHVSTTPPSRSTSALSADAASRALEAMNLVFQDCRCLHSRWQDAHRLGQLLVHLSANLGRTRWQDYYQRCGYRCHAASAKQDGDPDVPDIFTTLAQCLHGNASPWPTCLDIARQANIAASDFFGSGFNPCPTFSTLFNLFTLFSPQVFPGTVAERAANITRAMHQANYTQATLSDLAFFIALPLKEALRSTLANPPPDWSPSLYEFLGRSDLAKQAGGHVKPQRLPAHPDPAPSITQSSVPREDVQAAKARKSEMWDPSRTDKRDLGLPLFHDRRLEEVGRILRWSRPLVLRMPGVAPDSAEMPPPDKQVEFVKAVASRTQSLPAGAALFTFRTRPPLRSNESLSIPDITLSVKLLPMGLVMALDLASLPGERRRWPKFHTGVAMALQQNDTGTSPFNNMNRAFGKPQRYDLDSRHAGYLLGLGLTGQIRSIAVFQVFEYLDPKHELTSIGVLLGMSAAFVGTADPTVSSMLAVHLSALHPSGSADLNISLLAQSAALLGHGLLYMNTRQRTMADKILRELSRTLLYNREQAEVCREAYALSAGFAFGMIMLAQGGEEHGSEDEALLRRFKALLDDDGQSSLLSTAGKDSNGVDVSITSPAATVALTLMFLDSSRADVLDLLALPEEETRLDYIRPDLVLLRTIARSLIQLSAIKPTIDWVHSLLPGFLARAYRRSANVNGAVGVFASADLELAYWNIVTGACYSIGLRFAGSASLEAHRTLSFFLDQLSRPIMMKQTTLRGKLRQHSLQRSVSAILVALAMVFAGTGELHILQRLRMLHGRIGDSYDYGCHLAVHMSLGLLFLGGGRQTISSKAPGQLASLFLAFYPIWPRTSSDNQMHLQAYRHMWALAVEPRSLQIRDVDTDQLVHMPVKLHVTEPSPAPSSPDIVAFKALSAPTLLPELFSIRDIRIDSVRYWPVHLDLTSQHTQLQFESLVENQTLYVKRHAGRLDYMVDPRGIKGINSRSGLDTETITSELGHVALADERAAQGLEGIVSSFSSDPHAVATLKYLAAPLTNASVSAASRLFESLCTSVLMGTLSADKIDIAPIYHHMFLASLRPTSQDTCQSTLALRALTFALDFYTSLTWSDLFCPPEEPDSALRMPLVERAFVERIRLRLEQEMDERLETELDKTEFVEYMQGTRGAESAGVQRLLTLLRCPPQHLLASLATSVKEAAAVADPVALEEGPDSILTLATRRALQGVIPLSGQRDHWRIARLVSDLCRP